VTVRVSYFVPPAPHLAARAAGALDDLDVQESRTTGSPAQRAALVAGSIDLAVTAIDNLFAWPREGADVRLVLQVEATTPLSIVGRAGIATLVELDGARFAVDARTNGFALVARRLLEDAGVTAEFVEVGGVSERLHALLAGDVDATLLGPPFDAHARAQGLRILDTVQRLFPAFPGQGLVARTAALGDPDVAAYIAALHRHGATAVDPAGLDILTAIRRDLGLLDEHADLAALLAPVPSRPLEEERS
jgi:ABC-type nitrate/sulfonate/bicarbonate transport system substrate-binding protein